MLVNAAALLANEARALLTRVERLKPFALQMTMVAAAAISPAAQTAIERHLAEARRKLRQSVQVFLRWLQSAEARRAPPAEAQRRFTVLRLAFNLVLSQVDIFADVLTQRSEHDHGVWMAGLDAVAADAIRLPLASYQPPPVICYLDRGVGAAIRRARTRLPGGDLNPVAIIRVPRERMVGSGVASSLIHEVGHQAAALLGLIDSLRQALRAQQERNDSRRMLWQWWERWISEIVADLWAVAKVGIGATLGLLADVSLPFVFRVNPQDPHPMPWLRVKLSCAMGQALYPDRQWQDLANVWESFYPTIRLDPFIQNLIASLQAHMPRFVGLMLSHRPASLYGAALHEALVDPQRQPHRLRRYYRAWLQSPQAIRLQAPAFAFAVISQARADGKIDPKKESDLLTELLENWALRRTLTTSEACAARSTAPFHKLASELQTESIMANLIY
jgi:hypothetical protein